MVSAATVLMYAAVYPACAYAFLRLLRFYLVERYDPWFWGCHGLGAPSSSRLIHFVVKGSALFVSSSSAALPRCVLSTTSRR